MKIAPFTLERYFAKHEFSVPYLLSSSDCESLPISQVLALEPDAQEKFLNLKLGYTESLGSLTLRTQIAHLYQNISPDQILVHAGAEEAIFNFMNAMLDKDDHVVIQSPCYQSLAEIPKSIGCKISYWKAQSQKHGEFAFPIDDLKSQVNLNTKLIVVNSPHNPTGHHFTKSEMDQILEVAQSVGAYLFFDEVYRLLEYRPSERLPAACDRYPKAVSLGVMSKSLGLAGLRIGWIATQDRDVYQAMEAYKDYTSICSSAPSEYLAEIALKHSSQLLERNQKLVLDNLSIAEAFFNERADYFEWFGPKAGSICFPKWKKFPVSLDQVSLYSSLIDQQGLMLLSGRFFGESAHHFRLGLGRANFSKALQILGYFIDSNS